ncbi:uncharacterized protein BXZ73DRAFT_81930 [Epithele typhae]|uniref:uncharacterized protein n=1 Tax=Epithele typhae TaxID=378194 RepID=UPI00200794C7|nr:uncharacterized protein BXZ73DRAFT_81930 [Epithele typhae]KAH9913468.1 hypothetical protein BXZ73DRAFT_81930 [Epithele typhae]
MPDWFVTLHPGGTVPSVSYEGVLFNKSFAILELISELYPDSSIQPKSLLERTRVREFSEHFEKYVSKPWRLVFRRGEPPSVLLDTFVGLQAQLPPIPVGTKQGEPVFVTAEWSMAEMVTGPFLVRAWLFFAHDIGKYEAGAGPAAFKELNEGPKFARLRRYVEDIKAHPVWKATWDEEDQLKVWGSWEGVLRSSH